jgi:hypothetical protein
MSCCTSGTPSSGLPTSAFANPTGLIDLAFHNGVLNTAERSDARHALDQSIDPFWTGTHEFQNRIGFDAPTIGPHPIGWATPEGVFLTYAYQTGGAVLTGFTVGINGALSDKGQSIRGRFGGVVSDNAGAGRILVTASYPPATPAETIVMYDTGPVTLTGDFVLDFDLVMCLNAVDLRSMVTLQGIAGIPAVSAALHANWLPGAVANAQIDIALSGALARQVYFGKFYYSYQGRSIA